MKLFKRIYYPVLAVLTVLMLVLGIVDAHAPSSQGELKDAEVKAGLGYAQTVLDYSRAANEAVGDKADSESGAHNAYNAAAQERVRDFIRDTLLDAGALSMNADELDDDGNNLAAYYTQGDVLQPTVVVQKATVRPSSQSGTSLAALRQVQNVILAVPGSTDKAVLLYVRADSANIGGGADAAAIGAALEQAVRTLKSKPKNTVVFLFGDAGQEDDLGARAFMQQFVGFDNVAKKIVAVGEFVPAGTGGKLMVYGKSGENSKLIAAYAKESGGNFVSSALETLLGETDGVSETAFGDVATLGFTNRGGFDEYGTARDTTVSKTLLRQQLSAMDKFVTAFAGVKSVDKGQKAVYFSYLDLFTVHYPAAVSYVIGAVLLALLVAVIVLAVRNKSMNVKNVLTGLAVQLIVLAVTSLALLAAYYLFALLLSGFGSVPFHGISSLRYAGTGLLLSAAGFAIALSIFFYIVLKRTFGVKATDVVRGNVFLWTLLGAVLSFALPAVSYPFTCVALFSLLAMLMTVLFKARFKARYGTDIERLFLYAWAVVFALPLIMPLLYVAQTVFPAVTIVLVLAVVLGLAGFITPYADYLKPWLDRVFKKLPMRTVRYERTVTERVEDRAKKGKFTEVTSKKIVKEKVAWNYLNRIGVSFVLIVTTVMIILFGAFNATYSTAAVNATSFADSIYDDSLLFVYEKEGSATPTANLAVYDLAAYNYLRYAVNDMSWNGEKRAYEKEYTGQIGSIIPSIPDFEKSGDTITFRPFEAAYSQTTVTLRGASAVTSVKFNAGEADEQEFTFVGQDTISFRLPFGQETFTMQIDASCEVELLQHVYNTRNLKDNDDWKKVVDEYFSNKDIGPALRNGIVIRISKTI